MGTDPRMGAQGVPMCTIAGLVAQDPVSIKENWVMSDACEKQCLLPFRVEHSSL